MLQSPTQSTEPEEVQDLREEDDRSFLRRVMPTLEDLEEIRRAKQKVYRFRKSLALPAVLIGTPLMAYLDYMLLLWQRGNDDSGAGLTFVFLGAIYWWVTQPKRDYAKAYKKEILPKIARLFGNFRYDISGKIMMSKMLTSKIVPGHDRYRSEDYFQGRYKGVDIEFNEMHLTETRGSGKNRRTVTTFKGLAILLGMRSKKFYGHTILDKDKSKISEWFQEKSTKMKRARMADPEFEKLFDAYTTDQVEARYLIDPIMIERLKDLFEQYTNEAGRDYKDKDTSWIEKLRGVANFKNHVSKNLRAAFYENKMLILISSNFNHFEPADLHIPATDSQSILHLKEEIGDILAIIDQLNLYDPKEIERQKLAEAS